MASQSQIAGNTSANIAEVEANTKALRVTLRPEDYGTLGIYSLASVSGLMAAGITAASEIFQFMWSDATRFALIKRITISAGNDATAFAAGSFQFSAFQARSFSVAGTGGTSIKPTSNQNKLRTTGMGTTLVGDVRISSTAALTAGTKTLDSNPFGALAGSVPATAGTSMFAPYPLLDVRPGEHPMLHAQNEGFCIQVTVPATGTWKFAVRVDWSELSAY